VVDEGLRTWAYRSLAIAFLIATVIAGLLVFPLGSALAMPDWYVNAARALAPWNYAFQFPNPPQGERGPLISADAFKLGIGVAVSLGAAAFGLFGRDLLGARAAPAPSLGTAPDGDQDEEHPQHDEPEGPEPVEIDRGQVLASEEVEAEPDQDQPEEPGSAP